MKRLIAAVVVMIILSIAIVVVAVNKASSPAVTNYQDCVDKGYPVRESYPTVCSVPGGKSFTNPDQPTPTSRDDIRKRHAIQLASSLLTLSLNQREPLEVNQEIFERIATQSGLPELLSDPLTTKPYVFNSSQIAMIVGEATYGAGATCDNKISGSQGTGLIVDGSPKSLAVAIKLESDEYACESNL